MAVREFDGTDDVIICDAGNTSAIDGGPVTVAAWVKPDSDTQDLGLFAGYNASQEVYAVFMAGSAAGVGELFGGIGNFTGYENGYTDGQWQLILYTKATGVTPVRWHVYDPGADTWAHVETGNAEDEATPVVENQIGQAFGSFYRGRLAVVAVWDSVVGNDAAVEALGLETSLSNWEAASPSALWPLNQSSVGTPVEDTTNGGADQNSITGTTVVTGDDPPGFSFTTSVTGTLAVTEEDDTLAASSTFTPQPVTGTLDVTEEDDTLAASGTFGPTGSLNVTEEDDTLAASGNSEPPPVTGTLDVTEEDDTLAANGTSTTVVTGTLAVTEEDDTLDASGMGGAVVDLTIEVGPTRIGTLVVAGSRIGTVDVANTRDSWTIGITRQAWTVGETRRDRGE